MAISTMATISRLVDATKGSAKHFAHETTSLAGQYKLWSVINPSRIFEWALSFVYIWIQLLIVALFKPRPPTTATPANPHGRIAVIGAGLTGISSAAHAVAHGFDVVIFEADDKPGGIWAHVNSTSGLQLNSLLYRFHPSVVWSGAFPRRNEIVSEITRVWKEYKLEERTRFKTPVTSVKRAPESDLPPKVVENDLDPSKLGHSRWIVNDGSEGIFDAVIITIGTCGKPKMISLPGMPKDNEDEENSNDGSTSDSSESNEKHSDNDIFKGQILHSSQLDELESSDLEGKTIVVVGSGASGVEAVETALAKGAKHTVMLARDDKWIIPRNMIIDTFLAAQPFGRQMPLSFLWERFIAWWNYKGVKDLVPANTRIFGGTPVVNDEFLGHVRNHRCDYIRGDTKRLTSKGVLVNVRTRTSKPGDEGEEKEFEADVVVMATGFERPNLKFIEDAGLFPDGYERPNLYLQNFATEDWSVLMTNTSYVNGIGTVGHFHIGIYTRILLTFLMDKNARPLPKDMKLWVDAIQFVKRGATGGALGFFTYMELTIWLLLFHVFRLDRIRWVFFIMQGWGVHAPREKEE